jgi:Ca-activated chloride channel family protein
MEIVFSNPMYLWMLLTIPVLIITHFFVFTFLNRRAMRFANFEVIKRIVGPHGNAQNYHAVSTNLPLLFIRIFAVLFLVLSAAGTVLWYQGRASASSYVIAIDASSSMLATDLSPTRLSAAKSAAALFVSALSGANAAVIDFSGTSFVKQPLTDDMIAVKSAIEAIDIENVGGTAIGDAIIESTNMLASVKSSKSIILITDGQSNVGSDIKDGISHANNINAVVHTIGIGTETGGYFIKTELVSKLDEESLQKIANDTGGKYFRAADAESLAKAYSEISSISLRKISLEISGILLMAGIVLIFLEWTLLNTKYRTLP